MAYARTRRSACPIPADPGVVSAYIVITTGETNVPIYVPWDNVKLVYAYTTFSSNIGGAVLDGGACGVDLELDSAGGTALGTITIASGAAVGEIDELDLTSVAAAHGLNSTNAIMVEIDGHASTTLGAFNIYLYFEADR